MADLTTGQRVHSALTRLLRWSSRSRVWQETVAGSGHPLSPTDVFLLEAVVNAGPLRTSDLAAWQGVDKSTVTPQVQRLAAAGLVARSPDPGDRRAALLTATDAGRAVHEQIGRGGARLVDDLTAGWPDRERRELARLLDKLAAETGPGPAGRTTPPGSAPAGHEPR